MANRRTKSTKPVSGKQTASGGIPARRDDPSDAGRAPRRAKATNAARPSRHGARGNGTTSSRQADGNDTPWELRLYVAGQTPRSTAAFANLKRICDAYLPGKYAIEVVDLMKTPQLARDHQILAIPTLVRKLPEPLKRIVGDLSNTERALVGLDLQAST